MNEVERNEDASPSSFHSTVSDGQGPSGGLTGEAAGGNDAATTQVDAPLMTEIRGLIADSEKSLHAAVRAFGGIVHSDGNIFFTNANQLERVINHYAELRLAHERKFW